MFEIYLILFIEVVYPRGKKRQKRLERISETSTSVFAAVSCFKSLEDSPETFKTFIRMCHNNDTETAVVPHFDKL